MTHSLHPAAQKGFSSAAQLYQQVRPNYPSEIVNWLIDELKLQSSATVVDLGSGTGKFLPYLKQVCAHIIAVEPVKEMLEQLQIQYPDIKTLQNKSDKIDLASDSVDAVLCAQAFHWFADLNTLNEIHRILKPEGHLGLIWNQRDENVPWVKALADLIAPFEGDTPRYHSEQWKQVFNPQFLFEFVSLQLFSKIQTGTVENVVSKRLLSTSFIAAMPPSQQQQLKQQFEHIIFEHTGKQVHDVIDFPYVTYAYHFKKLKP